MFGYYLFFIALYGLIQVSVSLDNCENADPNCIDPTLNEMHTRRNYLIYNSSCDHNAVFATFYQYMTQDVGNNLTSVTANGSRIFTKNFPDPPWMARIDRVFANYYFDPRDRWTTDQHNLVPQVWKIAFEAADRRELLALGDALLGINAHVNRDLPFVVASIGLVNADGSSTKPGYDHINDILHESMNKVMRAVETEFDPNFTKIYNPLTKYLSFKTISGWREMAWNNAVKLTNAAPYPFAYGLVKTGIENYATTLANSIRLLAQTDSKSRDSYCRRAHGLA